MTDVIDLQKKVKLELAIYSDFTHALPQTIPEIADRHFTVAFIGDARMKQLNELFRDRDVTTDVLSFPREPDEFDPHKDNLGDIVISAEQAERQAAENGLSLELEIKQLILHGVLHLCGYDHETDAGIMSERELELRAILGI